MLSEFTEKSGKEIASKIKGKTVKNFKLTDCRMDDFIEFEFDDGSVLRFCYDYIYSWDVAQEGE